ncbi:mucin-1-like [Dermacentor silvarum]|uniref:mucin-1-like n=1 Tax=Dermacentor silvarum TaxID=543639 RepID=UPI0018980B3C|nr:mucin-1-like [Dermacentor silvarum]
MPSPGESEHEQPPTTEGPAVDSDASGSDSDVLGARPPKSEDEGGSKPADGDHATPASNSGDNQPDATTPSSGDANGVSAGAGHDGDDASASGDGAHGAGGDEDTKTNEVTDAPKATEFPTRYTTTPAPAPAGGDDHHDDGTTEAAPSAAAGADASGSSNGHKDEPCGDGAAAKSQDTTESRTHDPIVQLVKAGIPDLHLDGAEPHRDRRRSERRAH